MDDVRKFPPILLRNTFVLALYNFLYQLQLVCSFKRVLKSAKFVKNTSQRPDITLGVVRTIFALFGGEVVGGADFGVEEGVSRFEHFGHAKVPDSNVVVLGKIDVERFDVPMQDVLGVQVVDAETNLHEELPDCVF